MHKVTLTGGRKENASQVEERSEEPRKRNPCSVIADSFNEIRERCVRTWKVVQAACAMVEVEDKDELLETMKEMPQKQIIIDL